MKEPQSRKKALGIIHRYCLMQFTSNQQKEFLHQIKKLRGGRWGKKGGKNCGETNGRFVKYKGWLFTRQG